MNRKPMESYELIDGISVIDSNYVVVYANESMYRFMGIATSFNIIDIIHQVDFDDFADVAHALKPGKTQTMVVRMRRKDNSYRWMLLTLSKYEYANTNQFSEEYIELDVSDIYALKKQNIKLREVLIDYSHLMALDSELMYTYYFDTELLDVFHFVDNDIITLLNSPFHHTKNKILAANMITGESFEEFEKLCEDILHGKSNFSHTIHILNGTDILDGNLEFKGSTVYKDMKPVKVVGSIRNCDHSNVFNMQTNFTDNHNILNTKDELIGYIQNNIRENDNCELTCILIQIDQYNNIVKEDRQAADEMFTLLFHTARTMTETRGIIGKYQEGIIMIVIKDICEEVNTRAFLESLRSKVYWDYKKSGSHCSLTLSMGISRYPFNGKDIDILMKKMMKALYIANEKGCNRFILYKETLHGEL